MRHGLAVLALLLAALCAAPGSASAAPHHNKGLTINATPNPNVTGDPILIYGQLTVPEAGGRTIRLFHRVNPAAKFTLVKKTKTNALGFYEFTRADGVVLTNRSWFVRGPKATHSRTVHEHVAALLTLAASAATGLTNHPLTFNGLITPVAHVGEVVVLEAEAGDTGGGWVALGTGVIAPGGTYSIVHNFVGPGDYELRTVFAGDARNTRGVSDLVAISVQQTQNPSFTIATSAPVIDLGNPLTVSGVLWAPGSATMPVPGASVTLWGHEGGGPYAAIASTITGADGSYVFTQAPAHNMVLQVRTTTGPRLTAQLFEGVRDVVTITSSAPVAGVGGSVTFTGTVTPDKAAHVIYLQRLGADERFHTVEVGRVTPTSTYSFKWTFGNVGTPTFRVRIPGGASNVGGASPTLSITVSLPSIESLPPAS